MFEDALGNKKSGSLIDVRGMPYNLYEGWDIDEVRAEAKQAEESQPESFRCRHNWHDMEIIAVPEPMPPVTQNGKLLSHYLYLARYSGNLLRCRRCNKVAMSSYR